MDSHIVITIKIDLCRLHKCCDCAAHSFIWASSVLQRTVSPQLRHFDFFCLLVQGGSISNGDFEYGSKKLVSCDSLWSASNRHLLFASMSFVWFAFSDTSNASIRCWRCWSDISINSQLAEIRSTACPTKVMYLAQFQVSVTEKPWIAYSATVFMQVCWHV